MIDISSVKKQSHTGVLWEKSHQRIKKVTKDVIAELERHNKWVVIFAFETLQTCIVVFVLSLNTFESILIIIVNIILYSVYKKKTVSNARGVGCETEKIPVI